MICRTPGCGNSDLSFLSDEEQVLAKRWLICMAEAGYPKAITSTSHIQSPFSYYPTILRSIDELKMICNASFLSGLCALHGCASFEDHARRWIQLNGWHIPNAFLKQVTEEWGL